MRSGHCSPSTRMPTGNQTGEPRVFEPGEALAVTVESSSDPVKQLVGVEIHLAVGEGSEQGLLIWSIKTA